jgi:hypothetical protein
MPLQWRIHWTILRDYTFTNQGANYYTNQCANYYTDQCANYYTYKHTNSFTYVITYTIANSSRMSKRRHSRLCWGGLYMSLQWRIHWTILRDSTVRHPSETTQRAIRLSVTG